nr:hypothetical protein [Stenotrophomonas indicatrix]
MADQLLTTELPDKQLKILRHALGIGEGGWERSHRNHFVTGEGGSDHALCMALVERGLMTRRPGNAISGGSDIFTVTAAGRTTAVAPPPKQSPSQKRYRAYLVSDTDLSFIDWLRRQQPASKASTYG